MHVWIYTDNKLAKIYGNILSLSENIAKSFRGGYFFLTHTVDIGAQLPFLLRCYKLLPISDVRHHYQSDTNQLLSVLSKWCSMSVSLWPLTQALKVITSSKSSDVLNVMCFQQAGTNPTQLSARQSPPINHDLDSFSATVWLFHTCVYVQYMG